MKMTKMFTTLLIVATIAVSNGFSQSTFSPYYGLAPTSETVDEAMVKVSNMLQEKGFEILGSYHPEGKSALGVVVFTNDELKNTVIPLRDRGIHAAALRAGFVSNGGKTTISFTNPDYFFHAYLQDDAEKARNLRGISSKVRAAFRTYGAIKGFGGSHDADKLKKYRYMMGMEGFRNPVELNSFSSFKAGVAKIESDLKRGENGCALVYSIIDEKNQVAMFGVSLQDKEKGEPHFLPIIGEEHAAALPYEIVLQGKDATMLHGRFRIALHWPDLTMGTFSKIMSTPGDIKDLLQALTE
jgi:hypothetical protein